MNFKFFKDDLLAGLVVFFIAVPLCLGIAVASGAPAISGLISGIIGGVVIGFLSKSQVSVSGPAAGLVAIILAGISTLGFKAFLLAILLAGVFQFLLGLVRAGSIAYFFPSSVIKGMLTAIGIIIILKQLPHFIGYDADYEGDFSFIEPSGNSAIDSFILSFSNFHTGVIIVGVASILAIIFWDKFKRGPVKFIPGAIMGVVVGLVLNQLLPADLKIQPVHLVQIPVLESATNFAKLLTFPDFTAITNVGVWISAITIALVASIETLLTIEATDKIDPQKRVTPTNRELMAQGIGNAMSGLLGGLPITSVIIRSSANISSGGKTKLASIIHGIFILLGVLFFASFLNLIPLTSLAAILLVTGYKLVNPKAIKQMFAINIYQWLPFIITVIAIVFTDLLKGIGVGLLVSVVFILIKNLQNSHFESHFEEDEKHTKVIELTQEVTFLNKATILITLDRLPNDSSVLIDASRTFYIDYDVLEVIKEFAEEKAPQKNISVKLKGFKEEYPIQINPDLQIETT